MKKITQLLLLVSMILFTCPKNILAHSTITELTQDKCTCCSGKGTIKCTKCNGSGITKAKMKGFGTFTKDEDFCSECIGVGKNTCTCCNGTGSKKPQHVSPGSNKVHKAY